MLKLYAFVIFLTGTTTSSEFTQPTLFPGYMPERVGTPEECTKALKKLKRRVMRGRFKEDYVLSCSIVDEPEDIQRMLEEFDRVRKVKET